MELKDLFRLEDVLGLPLGRRRRKVRPNWMSAFRGVAGLCSSRCGGDRQLRNVRAEMRGLNTPIEIVSAAVSLTSDAVSMQKISARTEALIGAAGL